MAGLLEHPDQLADRDVLLHGDDVAARILSGQAFLGADLARVESEVILADQGDFSEQLGVFFADDSRTSPPFATYFALNMMLMAEHGSAHAKTEMAAWLRAAGFTQVEIRDLPPPNPHSLVLGIKP